MADYEEIKFEDLTEWLPDEDQVRACPDPLRVIVLYRGYRFPVSIDLKENPSPRLLALYNGAINRGKAPDGVVFQRSSWTAEFDADVVGFADPTLVKLRSGSIGWGQLSGAVYANSFYPRILDLLRKRYFLALSFNTLHYGSSAGGFQAVSSSAYDTGSTALVNNPQLDWSLYDATHSGKIFSKIYRDESGGAETKAKYPWRVNVTDLFLKLKHTPKLVIYINTASDSDFQLQLPRFLDGISNLEYIESQPSVRIELYRNEASGHNPLNKTITLKVVNDALSRLNDLF